MKAFRDELPRKLSGLAKLGLSLFAVFGLFSCQSYQDGGDTRTMTVDSGIVIRAVSVVNTRDGSLQADRAVIILNGRIQTMVPDASLRVGARATVIDGRGKFLVPGYLDMHTHALSMEAQGAAPWAVMVAHGVTGIREMNGNLSLIRRAAALNRERIDSGFVAPEVVSIASDLILGVGSPALARRMVQEQKEAGASFIKVINADRDVTLAILEAAKAQGMHVAGHLSAAVGAEEVARAGWRSIEHLGGGMGMLIDCAKDAAAVRRAIAAGEGAKPGLDPLSIISPLLFRAGDASLAQRLLDSHDATRCDTLAAATTQAGTWQVPTMIRLRAMAFSDDQRFRQDPALVYVDKTRRALWEQLAVRYTKEVPTEAAAVFRRQFSAQQRMLNTLRRQGAQIMAGSDLGGIWVIPGAGLHHEFAELAEAGLSPLEVLQAATLRPAQFLDREAELGSVDVGKRANLVLLAANPLLDVKHLGSITDVVLEGRHLDRATLDTMLRDAATKLEQAPMRKLASVVDASHRH